MKRTYSHAEALRLLIRVQMREAMQLLRVALHSKDAGDIYDALGFASELIDDADRNVCKLPDEELGIVDGRKVHKSVDELTRAKPLAARPKPLSMAKAA